ncbi:MAG: DMT family transporter [Bradyrhizobium sp.]
MSPNSSPSSATRPLGPGAIAIIVVLCVSWAFNQIAVKLTLPEIPPMLQATLRSVGALPVLLIVGWARGAKMFERDGTLIPGLVAGAMFGVEFVLIYGGLLLTSASRAVVFLYTAPFFVALGSYRFLGERLGTTQWTGLALSFAGVALAIGVPQANVDGRVLLGDLMVVGGGLLWGATTVMAKGTRLRFAPPEKALAYQVAMSIPILGAAALFAGERLIQVPSPFVLSLMAYQSIWVVGTTFTIWFALIKAYSASKLSAFTFITPLFGVVASYFILHDALTLAFGFAAVLVIIGLFLVNRPNRVVLAATDPLLNVTKT